MSKGTKYCIHAEILAHDTMALSKSQSAISPICQALQDESTREVIQKKGE